MGNKVDRALGIMVMSKAALRILPGPQQVECSGDLRVAFALHELEYPFARQGLCHAKMVHADQQIDLSLRRKGTRSVFIGRLQTSSASQGRARKLPIETQRYGLNQKTQQILKSQPSREWGLLLLDMFEGENITLLHIIGHNILKTLRCMIGVAEGVLQQRLVTKLAQNFRMLLTYMQQISKQVYQAYSYLRYKIFLQLVKKSIFNLEKMLIATIIFFTPYVDLKRLKFINFYRYITKNSTPDKDKI